MIEVNQIRRPGAPCTLDTLDTFLAKRGITFVLYPALTGVSERDGSDALVGVCEDLSEAEQIWEAAHQLAHIVLGSPGHPSCQATAARSIAAGQPARLPTAEEERTAHAWAACLLVNPATFNDYRTALFESGGLDAVVAATAMHLQIPEQAVYLYALSTHKEFPVDPQEWLMQSGRWDEAILRVG